ncbi:MAG TPA: cytochrome c oxidase subunit II [Fimbriiglobus sp.]|jgi:cytochrome c oxidase subunit 2
MTLPIPFPTIPTQASQFAIESDHLFWYITLLCVGGTGLVYVMVAYFCFRYAKNPGARGHVGLQRTPRILGSVKLEFLWSAIPTVLFLSCFAWGIWLWGQNTRIPPEAAQNEIYVVGKRWMWKIQHPDGTREINELHLAVDQPVKITVISEDVIHDFGIPAFRQKIDVVPGRYLSTWYKPTQIGSYHIFCDQYCGQGHSQMVGTVHVLSKSDYEQWREGTYRTKDGKNPVDGSAGWLGAKLFKKLNCISCHGADNTQRAPRLEGIFGTQIPIGGGKTVTVNDDYIRESIRNPMAKVHEGWKPIMPAFPVSQLTEEELLQVMAFVKGLRAGETPSRVEHTPPQIGANPLNSEGGSK